MSNKVTGLITVQPAITWWELKDTVWTHDNPDKDVALHMKETTKDMPNGQMVTREADAITPAQEDFYTASDIVEHLQDIVTAFGRNRVFTGYLHGLGEEGDAWRVVIHDGRARKIHPAIIWPGDPAPSPIAAREAIAALLHEHERCGEIVSKGERARQILEVAWGPQIEALLFPPPSTMSLG